MKIAVASEKGNVSGHFGHCEGFYIFEVENEEVKDTEFVENPGYKPGFLPNFLNDKGINVIISGGMGGGAIDIFNSHNIEVIIGSEGKTVDAINKYLRGELKSTGSVCSKHEHSDECH